MIEFDPPYWGTWKGKIIFSIINNQSKTWDEIQYDTQIPDYRMNEILSELYDLDIIWKDQNGRYFVKEPFKTQYEDFARTIILTSRRTQVDKEKHKYTGFPKTRSPRLIFVISSFADDMEDVFESLQKLSEGFGFEIKRVKDHIGDFKISEMIVELIESSKFIIADLTHERQNVYFELGYARALGKSIIQIAKTNSNIHFDVQGWKTIFYDDLQDLQRKISPALEKLSM